MVKLIENRYVCMNCLVGFRNFKSLVNSAKCPRCGSGKNVLNAKHDLVKDMFVEEYVNKNMSIDEFKKQITVVKK